MNSAEFKTIRESLGVSIRWFGELMGVKLRAAQYWESTRPPPPAAVQQLLSIDNAMNNIVQDDLLTVLKGKSNPEDYPSEVVLVRYRSDDELWRYIKDIKPLPASAHAQILSRTRRELLRHGIAVRIVYMDQEKYEAWLGKRKDSPVHRLRWAAAENGSQDYVDF